MSERKRRRRHLLVRRLLILVLVPILLLFFLNLRLGPALYTLASAAAKRKAESLISAAVYRELLAEPTAYTDIVTLSYKETGSVAALHTDTAALLALRTRLALSVVRSLDEEDLCVEVPLSSVLGLRLLSSRHTLPITLRLTRSMNAYFTSSFTECGINQTRHRVLFCISVDIELLIPGGTKRVTVLREFPLAETLIIGDVPDAYTKIDRLTDDITETEIDDIYDFGATAN